MLLQARPFYGCRWWRCSLIMDIMLVGGCPDSLIQKQRVYLNLATQSTNCWAVLGTSVHERVSTSFTESQLVVHRLMFKFRRTCLLVVWLGGGRQQLQTLIKMCWEVRGEGLEPRFFLAIFIY